ncbi:MAG TPA: hypothetical protein DCF33_12730 [Saprospirales bacterium]|nr:hypothetical protein [Saprospirales bacterium]
MNPLLEFQFRPATLGSAQNTDGYRVMQADIVFGTPSEQCKGHGICMIMPEGAALQLHCRSFQGLFIRESGDQFYLMMSRNQLPASVVDKFFSKPYFLMKEALVLPEFLASGLGLQQGCVIPTGRFKIVRSRQFFLISAFIRR